MSGVNKVILVGRLGQDPELRHTQAGQAVCNFNLATSEKFNGKDGNSEERTEWHRVVLWGKPAENAHKYLKKGRMVYIEGKIQTREWKDNQDQKRYTTEVVGTTMQFLNNSGSGSGSSSNSNNSLDSYMDEHFTPAGNLNIDDVPF